MNAEKLNEELSVIRYWLMGRRTATVRPQDDKTTDYGMARNRASYRLFVIG